MQPGDESLLVYPSAIMLTSVSSYGSSSFDFLPFSYPYCFIIKKESTSLDLQQLIVNNILLPMGLDGHALIEHIKEWDEYCSTLINIAKGKNSYSSSMNSATSYYHSVSTTNYHSASTTNYHSASTSNYHSASTTSNYNSTPFTTSSSPSTPSTPSSTPSTNPATPSTTISLENPNSCESNNQNLLEKNKGLPGGSIQTNDDPLSNESIDSDNDIHPENSYTFTPTNNATFTQSQSKPMKSEDWSDYSPFVPLVLKQYYSSSDWKSNILLCNNSSTPLKYRLTSSNGYAIYLVLDAYISSTLIASKTSIHPSTTTYYYYHDYYSDNKWAGKEWIKTTPIYTAFHKDNLLLQPISYSTQSSQPRDIPDLQKEMVVLISSILKALNSTKDDGFRRDVLQLFSSLSSNPQILSVFFYFYF